MHLRQGLGNARVAQGAKPSGPRRLGPFEPAAQHLDKHHAGQVHRHQIAARTVIGAFMAQLPQQPGQDLRIRRPRQVDQRWQEIEQKSGLSRIEDRTAGDGDEVDFTAIMRDAVSGSGIDGSRLDRGQAQVRAHEIRPPAGQQPGITLGQANRRLAVRLKPALAHQNGAHLDAVVGAKDHAPGAADGQCIRQDRADVEQGQDIG